MPIEVVRYIPTGSTLLDCVLGGGYGLGRMVQVYGDFSTGKTQLAISACINFFKTYPDGHCWYIDVESAFDEAYALKLGMPTDHENMEFWTDLNTVEDFESTLNKYLKALDGSKPVLIILDSLDALSNDKEMETDMRDKTGYGAEKAKALKEFFRKTVREMEKKNVSLFIISQVIDNITSGGYGPKTKPAGGKAVGFFASQRIELKSPEKIKKIVKGLERVVAVKVTAYCTKNKLGMPFRECPITIRFGKGIEDYKDCLEYLYKADQLRLLGDLAMTTAPKSKKDPDPQPEPVKRVGTIIERLRAMQPEERRKHIKEIKTITKVFWAETEEEFAEEDDEL